MFNRTDNTYAFDPNIVTDYILKDEANPLNRISALIPNGAKVLDIGAGNGLFACVLKHRSCDVTIDGIEPNLHAASIAKTWYRNFYTGFAQEFKKIIFQENYDFIVLADVIEHIPDPLSFLDDLCAGLSDHTKIIITTPNVAFGAIRIALLNGCFDYVDSGILERTHVRFFTLSTLRSMLAATALHVERLCFLQRSLFKSEIDIKRHKIGWVDLSRLARDDEALTYQFLAVLGKKTSSHVIEYFGERDKLPVLKYIILRLSNYPLLGWLSRIANRL
jgi:2-polyprenyl-3-methyl-5-hydroxy-6-metoxy-1,4-benzoquinol methylase